MQTAQLRAVGIGRRDRGFGRQPFDVHLRKRPRNVDEKPRPFGRGRGAEKLCQGGKLIVSAVDRRIGLVRPVDEKDRREDQMNRDDRGDHQRGDLSADTPEIEKPTSFMIGRLRTW